MSGNFDQPPLYDILTKNTKDYMSDLWVSWIGPFFETLTSYLNQNGVFLPTVTTDERDKFINPTDGQMIYNITSKAPQIFQDGSWKTFTTV